MRLRPIALALLACLGAAVPAAPPDDEARPPTQSQTPAARMPFMGPALGGTPLGGPRRPSHVSVARPAASLRAHAAQPRAARAARVRHPRRRSAPRRLATLQPFATARGGAETSTRRRVVEGVRVPVEVFGRTAFPVLTRKPLFLTPPPRAFYWMALEPQCGGAAGPIAIIPETQVPLLTISSRWEQVFVLPNKAALEAVLVTYLPTCGWFGGRQRPLGAVRVQEELRILCDLHLLEKAIYELGYELEHRPDWVRLPLRGILQLLERAS